MFPADIASQVFADDDGQPLTSIIFRDASAAQRARAALRDSEERYRTLFMTSPDAITVTDLVDGRYLDINDGFTQFFGWTRAEALGAAIGGRTLVQTIGAFEARLDSGTAPAALAGQARAVDEALRELSAALAAALAD